MIAGVLSGAGAQESGVFHAGAERLGVVPDAGGAGHRRERLQFGGGEVPDQPEVQEGDLAAAVERVAARVRVAVEGARVVQAADDEAVDRLGGQVAFVLRPAGKLGEPGPPDSSLVIRARSSRSSWRCSPANSRGGRHRRGEEPDERHAGCPARIRRAIRCRAWSTPG